MRYAIKHKPTGKFFYEDEGGTFLIEEKDGFITWGNKKGANKMYNDMVKYSDGFIFTEDGEIPVEEFEVAEL